jgi:hypothetical protein
VSTFLRTRRAGIACAGLAALTVTACGGGPVAAPAHPPTTTSAVRPVATSAANGSGPEQWIQQFCGKTQEDAELYITSLQAAVEMYAQGTTAHDMESDKQTLYSTVSSGLDAWMNESADQLAATTAAGAADGAARTYLLGVYQRLHQALAADEDRINALPTTDANRFLPAFSDVAGSVVSAVQDSKNAITSNGTLGPIYAANPNCR